MKYTVTKAVQLPAGSQVKLTEEQARRRGDQVKLIKGRLYECLVPVWVKAGEIIDLDEPAKHVQASLDPLDKVRAKAAAVEQKAAADEDTAPAASSESDPAAE